MDQIIILKAKDELAKEKLEIKTQREKTFVEKAR